MKGNIFIHITLKVSHIPSNSKKYINSILKKNELLGSGFARERVGWGLNIFIDFLGTS